MKTFTYSHFIFLAMSIAIPTLYSAQLNSSCALSSSSSSSASAHTAHVITPSTSHLAARQFYELGLRCQNGEGVAKNEKLAATFYKVAAKLGEPMAFLQLGFCYALGTGVSQDIERGLKLYMQGAALLKTSIAATPNRLIHFPQITKLFLAKLPCGHYMSKSNLEQVLQGRAEGQLPRCPACKQPFKTDQISASLV